MKTRFLLLFISLNFIFATSLFADVVYVNAAATPGGDGSSWNTAFTNLYDAIDAAQSGDEIWVAKGEYSNLVMTSTGQRSISFYLNLNLKFYGGFIGNENSIIERNFQSDSTVLASWMGGTLFDVNESQISILFDGFSFAGGSGNILIVNEKNDMSITFKNSYFSGNHYNSNGSINIQGNNNTLQFEDCEFYNVASNIFINTINSDIKIINSEIDSSNISDFIIARFSNILIDGLIVTNTRSAQINSMGNNGKGNIIPTNVKF